VRIWFSADHAPYVKERDWHPTQTIRENKDGSMVLSFKTNHLFEVKRWVLSWGAGARVLGPKELNQSIMEDIEAIWRKSRQSFKKG
jgi:predicted DNA-binding transcriptional regulator YafY